MQRKKLSKKWGSLSIRNKSIIIILTISIIFPLILPYLAFFIFGFNPPINSVFWNIKYESSLVGFSDISLLEISSLWVIPRFAILIMFGYLNGMLIETKLKNFRWRYSYLIVSSIIFYLILIKISIEVALVLLDKGFFDSPFFKFFDFFNF